MKQHEARFQRTPRGSPLFPHRAGARGRNLLLTPGAAPSSHGGRRGRLAQRKERACALSSRDWAREQGAASEIHMHDYYVQCGSKPMHASIGKHAASWPADAACRAESTGLKITLRALRPQANQLSRVGCFGKRREVRGLCLRCMAGRGEECSHIVLAVEAQRKNDGTESSTMMCGGEENRNEGHWRHRLLPKIAPCRLASSTSRVLGFPSPAMPARSGAQSIQDSSKLVPPTNLCVLFIPSTVMYVSLVPP